MFILVNDYFYIFVNMIFNSKLNFIYLLIFFIISIIYLFTTKLLFNKYKTFLIIYNIIYWILLFLNINTIYELVQNNNTNNIVILYITLYTICLLFILFCIIILWKHDKPLFMCVPFIYFYFISINTVYSSIIDIDNLNYFIRHIHIVLFIIFSLIYVTNKILFVTVKEKFEKKIRL